MEFLNGQTEPAMKDSGLKENNMETRFTRLQIVLS